jgi:hypothetical protein
LCGISTRKTKKQSIFMRGRASGHDFVDPIMLKILQESKVPLSVLGMNYMVNQTVGKTINLGIVKTHLTMLVKDKKISESFDKDKGITFYKLAP